MKDKIADLIREYIKEYENKMQISGIWGVPLIGFADAEHPDIINLKQVISETHVLPTEVLSSARVVVAYFVPFTRELSYTNRINGEQASAEWAKAYEETNAMFRVVNERLAEALKGIGYEAAVPKESYTFDREKLISDWSQRHIAKAAGLGTFGVNNMLITKAGCCGRFSSVITNLEVEPDAMIEEEFCIYLRSGRCGACYQRCPSGALTPRGFQRELCFKICSKNAEQYRNFGSSYSGDAEGDLAGTGSEVCGKCVTNVPCSHI